MARYTTQNDFARYDAIFIWNIIFSIASNQLNIQLHPNVI